MVAWFIDLGKGFLELGAVTIGLVMLGMLTRLAVEIFKFGYTIFE
jgi:hypothetical protein